jgi:hypothetical protein
MSAGSVKGFLEAVEPYQARGWVYDPANPQHPATVEMLLDGRVIGAIQANLYRRDLERSGLGAGNHAFIFNFERRLDTAAIARVAARVVRGDGSYQNLSTPSVVAPSVAAGAMTPKPLPTFEGLVSDERQRPVFVLGAARSGTSAMAQGLLKLGRFKGHQEGHLLDLLAHLSVSLVRFYDGKADDATGERDTMVSIVPQAYFQSALDEIFVRTVAMLFPNGDWIDKTPNSNMVHLAPRFRRMWPNARFIFMKRRFLENAASRSRKFPHYDFGRNCHEWSTAMEAWRSVRGELRGVAAEVDQRFFSEQPEATAGALREMLGLTNIEAVHLGQAFRHDRPERTSDADTGNCDISLMGWPPEAHRDFKRLCAELMDAYGYSTDGDYYRPGSEANGFVLV